VSIYRRNDLMYSKDVHAVSDRNHSPENVQRRDPGGDWAQYRKAAPADFLLPAGEAWFEQLPPDVRPCSLVTYYPRVANLIASQWRDRGACGGYFHDLLTDLRGNRQGFPKQVQRDLLHLRDYWYSL
jgi:hypothetical protein